MTSRSFVRRAECLGPCLTLSSASLPERNAVARRRSVPLSSTTPRRIPRLFVTQDEAAVASEEGLESNGVPQELVVAEEEEIDLHPDAMNEQNQHRVSRYQAKKACTHAITEGDRPLSEYMTLPVSQYSVLDAEKVERLDEDTFRVETSTVSLFKIKMTPVMKLTVKPHSTGCEVRLLECKLVGSQVVADANERFACYMRNYISYCEDEETGQLKLIGDCVVQVAGIVPRWISSVVPMKAFNGLGRRMLGKILDVAMPRFLLQLEKDYHTWAAGDDSRSPMSTGENFGIADEVLMEGNGEK